MRAPSTEERQTLRLLETLLQQSLKQTPAAEAKVPGEHQRSCSLTVCSGVNVTVLTRLQWTQLLSTHPNTECKGAFRLTNSFSLVGISEWVVKLYVWQCCQEEKCSIDGILHMEMKCLGYFGGNENMFYCCPSRSVHRYSFLLPALPY